jgi:SPP1 gp7 family putative phage head morphogenesis protein
MAINDSFWRNEKNRLLAILLPRLTQMSFEAAKQAAQKAGIGFNPALANANAANWARTYTDSLLDQLGTTSQAGIGELVGKWVETPGATYGELQKSLMQYGAVRAQAIAVTETTRAYSEGEMQAYKQEGITHIKWYTNRDEETCPVCRPLHGKVVKIGDEFGKDRKGKPFTSPPAHVNCRCSIVAVVIPDAKNPALLPKDTGQMGAVQHFQTQYGVYVDASPLRSPTEKETAKIDRVLSRLPDKFTKDNPRFTELEVLDDDPNQADARGYHQGNRITLYRKAFDANQKPIYAEHGTALDEVLAHEIGESLWKQTTPEFRAEWTKVAQKYAKKEGLENEPPNEQFAIWFSFNRVGDSVPPEIQRLVQ